MRRVERGFGNDLRKASRGLLDAFTPNLQIELNADNVPELRSVGVGRLNAASRASTGTFLGDMIARELPPPEDYRDDVWDVIEPARIAEMLERRVVPEVQEWQNQQTRGRSVGDTTRLFAEQLAHESSFAGLLLHLKEHAQFELLKDLFYKLDGDLGNLLELTKFRDPLDYIDPKQEIERATLSPIGVVHLFRQYFYEFDTFLGSPVGHVWLSPGSMVELVEVSTRRTLVERIIEQATETVLKTEESMTDEDEISEAVKQENRSDTKFGMNATVNQGWITGSATATTSLNLESTQSTAREKTHRQMRQQSEKLSTEIRRNYKSTFRTVTETTDTSSKRYVLNNTTSELVNYELRRKMRQVGVQVQDIGTYLCWQTFVDDPGRNLGIAKLVHIAKDPETGAVPPPEAVPRPGAHATELTIDIPFVPRTEDTEPDEDMDEAYRYGTEVNTDFLEGTPEMVQYRFGGFRQQCDLPNYEFSSIEFDYGGQDVLIELADVDAGTPGEVGFGIVLKHVNFRNSPTMRVKARVNWQPSATIVAAIDAQNAANVASFNEATKRAFEKAYLDAARERIEAASRIEQRPFEELREEERIVVYRALIQDMLTKGIPFPDDRTRHVVSELLNTIFDIDKMLYFVAPEWWRPRLHRSHQALGASTAPPRPAGPGGGAGSAATSVHQITTSAMHAKLISGVKLKELAAHREDTTIPATSVVSWGGVGENRSDNYYITEDSEPARLGASLGWLLQLDGDNLRNAFLNAPWVKAVIPIRPGREQAAINWLSQVNVEGTDGLDAVYAASPAELAEIPTDGPQPTIRDAIDHLCAKVAEKHAASNEVKRFPADEIDDANRVSATPVDKVFEHGFYPLQGGFRVIPGDEPFEVFDQWIEVLPTDQVVPVEVRYDPKTGRQL